MWGYDMNKVDKYDPVRMFNQGCAFCDITEMCIKEPNVFQNRTKSHFIVGLVNSLLACEIFMKTIIVIKDSDKKPRGHDLTNLWKQIKELDNDLTIKIESRIIDLYNTSNVDLFDDKLEVIKIQFEKLRYAYELNSIKSDPNFIIILGKVLRNICDEELKKSKGQL